MEWRPKREWVNPYSKDKIKRFDYSRLRCEMINGTACDDRIRQAMEKTFEEGADAMHREDIKWLVAEDAENFTGILGASDILIIKVRRDKWQAFRGNNE